MVKLKLYRENDKIKFEVKDEGPGISKSDQHKVCERFTKSNAKPTANETSNGLGLSIVKKYVTAMHGKISPVYTPIFQSAQQ